jgi:hypothetical protein
MGAGREVKQNSMPMEQVLAELNEWIGGGDKLFDEALATLLADYQRLRAALEQIAEEPNRLGLMADEVVDEYDIKAWDIAAEALR